MIWRKTSEQHVLNGGWRTRWVRTRSEQHPVQQRPRTQRGGGEAWRGAPALSPHHADKPGNEKSEAGEASRGRGGVCVWPRRSVWLSRRLHRWWCSRQEWGAAVHMHHHNLTALASPPHSFHHHHFVCDVRTKVKRKYWMMFVHDSIIFKRCIPQKTSLRILNHHGLFFYCVLSILRSSGSHQKFSKQEFFCNHYIVLRTIPVHKFFSSIFVKPPEPMFLQCCRFNEHHTTWNLITNRGRRNWRKAIRRRGGLFHFLRLLIAFCSK